MDTTTTTKTGPGRSTALQSRVFRPEEDTRGYFDLMEGLIQRWGIPIALYRRSPRRLQVLRKPPPHPTAGGSHPLQPGHCGTGHTADLRPLAPGQGPGGTHGGDFSGPVGDRTTPGRHAGTIDRANTVLRDFLPRYNARFAVPAELPEPAYRTWDSQRNLAEILCFKHTRKVARDNTVR